MYPFQQKRIFTFIALALSTWLLNPGPAAAQHRVRLPSGEVVEGSAIRLDDEGNYVLTTPRGDLTFPSGTPVSVAEPSEFTRGQQLLQQGRAEQAVRLLQTVVESYRGLQWDDRARAPLADALFAQRNFERAADLYEQIADTQAEAFADDGRVARHLAALQNSGREEALFNRIRHTIRHRSRNAAAHAQLLRANLNLERGETERALLDFLRTALLFEDVPEQHAEALAKTARIMRQLGHDEAETFALRLRETYPDYRN